MCTEGDPGSLFVTALEDMAEQERLAGYICASTLLVVCHTASNIAINLQIADILKSAKNIGTTVCVDGAHGLLAHNLDLARLPNNDYYVLN